MLAELINQMNAVLSRRVSGAEKKVSLKLGKMAGEAGWLKG